MKKILLLAVLAATAIGVSGAAGASRTAPPSTLRGTGPAGSAPQSSLPPSYCRPPACLYYSGDFNLSNSNANGLANWNTLFTGTAQVWQPVRPTLDWRVTGMLFNVLASTSVIDPTVTPWQIRTGVSSGNGGSVYAGGSSFATFTPTGRSGFGLTEYTLKVTLPTAVILQRNVTYFVNILPQCTNAGDSACSSALYYLSTADPPGVAPNRYGPPDVIDDSFFDSPFFAANFVPAQTECGGGCDLFSVGIIGAKLYRV